MKIGIITFHNAYNNGAVLQAYATQELIRMYGHVPEIIDYHNKAIDNNYIKKMFNVRDMVNRRWWTIPKYLLEKILFRKQRNAYHSFIKENFSMSGNHIEQSNEKISLDGYDVIMIGSDQLWNKTITGGFDNVYWGDFEISQNKHINAWSICMNEMELNDEERNFIIAHLDNFDNISVREENLKEYLMQLTNKKIYHTLDPTLLLPKTKWLQLCHPVKEKNYIFVYAIRHESSTFALAKKIGKKMNKKVIYFHNNTTLVPEFGHIQCGAPNDFLSYINSADFVVSSSFHGTAFSIIFNKPFVAYEPRWGENIRIHSLLSSFNLENQIISDINDFPNEFCLNYDIETVIRPTLDFLKKVIREAEEAN